MRFVVQMLVDAMAPSNNPFAQPGGAQGGARHRGRNYATGLKQFVQDMCSRPRIPAMVDGRGFAVGGNLARHRGAVVLRTPIFELIQYRPRTEQVRELPLLLVPPMINKFYVADLAPGRSMIEHWLDDGQQVFAMSWRNPTAEHREWDLDAYAGSVLEALDAVQEITGAPRSHVLGLCAGGIVSARAVPHLAATGERRPDRRAHARRHPARPGARRHRRRDGRRQDAARSPSRSRSARATSTARRWPACSPGCGPTT